MENVIITTEEMNSLEFKGKTVYVADKSSYGISFECIFNSLHDLKNGIIQNEHGIWHFGEKEIPYSEELAMKCIKERGYTLYKVELHDDECITFDEYDGQSFFRIEKKVENILSTTTQIKL
jgi:hypothetical protein